MWFNFLFGRSNATRTQARQLRLSVEALDGRILPSAVSPAPPPADAVLVGELNAGVLSTQSQTFDVDGTFSVTGVHGSRLSATVDGNLILDGGAPLHFTIDAHVKVMGNKIEGSPTMVFDDGSTLEFYYDLRLNKDTGIFEGRFWISGGTGQFEGASGRGDISYPVAKAGPITMDGTILY